MTVQVTLPDPDVPPGDVRRRMFEVMVSIRACDDRLRRGLSAGEFACTYWPATGQEAIAAALGAVLRTDDQLVTTYRGLHDQLAKGVPVGPLVAEILTRETGQNGGKGGAMHIADPPSGLVLSTGIVGSGLPIAVGLGLAARMTGSDRVAVASFGDGASGTGAFHEAVNLAALWELPVVLVCQNNRYAEMTPTAHAQPVIDVADRARGYGIPGVTSTATIPTAPTLLSPTPFSVPGPAPGPPWWSARPSVSTATTSATPCTTSRQGSSRRPGRLSPSGATGAA
jgi:TPP-dependent pyruvate/acetoin dehydrogenase alpha subunit